MMVGEMDYLDILIDNVVNNVMVLGINLFYVFLLELLYIMFVMFVLLVFIVFMNFLVSYCNIVLVINIVGFSI